MTRTRIENGVEVLLTPEEEAQRDIEEKDWADEQVELKKTQYQRDRAEAYPSIKDQLDDLYHNGIDGWKATIKVIKDKFPKPQMPNLSEVLLQGISRKLDKLIELVRELIKTLGKKINRDGSEQDSERGT